MNAEVIQYGDGAAQLLDLYRPSIQGTLPVVVLVHGGFWSATYDRSLMQPLVPDLLAEGWAVANLEYRSVPDQGSGWPGTFEDVAAGVDALIERSDLDVDNVITLGHSAGGHLAVWLASRHRLPAGAPGADPAVVVRGAVSQAGVLDLVAAARARLGGGAVQAFLGGTPDTLLDVYAATSPAALVPIDVPVELVHATRDQHVPIDQSRRYEAAARQVGDPVRLTETDGDHFAVIDPTTPDWTACLAAARRLLD